MALPSTALAGPEVTAREVDDRAHRACWACVEEAGHQGRKRPQETPTHRADPRPNAWLRTVWLWPHFEVEHPGQ